MAPNCLFQQFLIGREQKQGQKRRKFHSLGPTPEALFRSNLLLVEKSSPSAVAHGKLRRADRAFATALTPRHATHMYWDTDSQAYDGFLPVPSSFAHPHVESRDHADQGITDTYSSNTAPRLAHVEATSSRGGCVGPSSRPPESELARALPLAGEVVLPPFGSWPQDFLSTLDAQGTQQGIHAPSHLQRHTSADYIALEGLSRPRALPLDARLSHRSPSHTPIATREGLTPGFFTDQQQHSFWTADLKGHRHSPADPHDYPTGIFNDFKTFNMAEVQQNMMAPPHLAADAPVSSMNVDSPHDNETLPEVLARNRKRSHDDMNGDAEHVPPMTEYHPPQDHQMSEHPVPEHHIPEPYPGHGHQDQHPDQHENVFSQTEPEPPQQEGSQSAEEHTSPKGSRSFKRGDPPVNPDNKYYCDFSEECAGITFERKCEWSKHMDKHDRPYRCTHQECAKLQGFTYSGGLLRHEREVHGKHGGPKAALMCPFEDCKRHSGKGFTRKENLNEHIRRVHESKGQAAPQVQEPSQPQFPDFGSELQEAAAGADQITEPPVARMYDDTANGDLAIEPSLAGNKRKREDEDEENLPELNEEEMKVELKRLRSENKAKDHRLRMLEASEAMRDEQIKQLQETQPAQQGGYVPYEGQSEHERDLQQLQPLQQVTQEHSNHV
ncbi:hypothetical protein D0862_03480 [Hortaea werneckii]|uniref:C2H2-type domain-containing protein n=1 Tax=Hortaea werneckii TaxID=91943 RepID=A0A3M7HAC9_HORWE|nr:hypothetical protein D0862_03480 [Hortaea werneckii]